MRALFFFTTMSALLLGVSCTKEARIIVENTGSDSEMVLRHNVPIGKANPMIIQDTLSGSENILFRVSAPHPAFVWLQDVRSPKNHVLFPVQRGKTYRLAYDGSEFAFCGPGQEAQRLYNAIPRFSHPDHEPLSYVRSGSPVRPRLDSARSAQMAQFDSLKAIRKLSPELYDLIAADRECHALNVLYRTNFYQDTEEERLSVIDDVFERFDADSDRMLGALDYFDLMMAYAERKLLDRMEELMPLIDGGENNRLIPFYFDVYKKSLTGERLESIFAWQWLDFFLEHNFEKELIPLYREFEQLFPRSPYLVVMKGYFEELVAFNTPEMSSEGIFMMDDTDSITSIDALLARFAGKKLYIDVWATWCSPCKKEFEHEDALHRLLADKGYEMLYLSVDKDRDDAKWRKMADYYQLRGYHIRAGKKLEADIRKLFDADGSIVIPWNMIIDESGHIVNLHAPRPSDTEELSKALD